MRHTIVFISILLASFFSLSIYAESSGESCRVLTQHPFYRSRVNKTNLLRSNISQIEERKDIVYQDIKGVDAKFQKMDVYFIAEREKSNKSAKPYLVYLHGGDSEGDKSFLEKIPQFIPFFVERGFVFANVNYRVLGPATRTVTLQNEVDDIVTAMGWLNGHAGEFGARADDFVILGFSSGAHLSALLNSDETYLKKGGLSFASLKGVLSLDVPHYNEPLNLELLEGTYLEPRKHFLKKLFGDTAQQQFEGSPSFYLNEKKKLKPFFLMTAGSKDHKQQNISYLATAVFKAELEKSRQPAQFFPMQNFSHVELGFKLNRVDQEPVATAIGNFLDRLYSSETPTDIEAQLEKKILETVKAQLRPKGGSKAQINEIKGAIVGYVSPIGSLLVSCGKTDQGSSREVSDATLFGLGSASEIFLGLLLAKAVHEGKIKLDAKIGNYLPSPLKETFAKDAELARLSFQQIATRSSGFNDKPKEILKLNSLLELNLCLKKKNKGYCRVSPSGLVPSDVGIGLLGIALLNVIQDPVHNTAFDNYNSLLQQYLLIPLGIDGIYGESDLFLNAISYFEAGKSENMTKALESLISQYAQGHNLFNKSQQYFADFGVSAAAGEVVANGRSMLDLLMFLAGINTSPVISDPVLEVFRENTKNGDDIFGKSGMSPAGYSAQVSWSKKKRTGVFIMTNSLFEKSTAVNETLVKKLFSIKTAPLMVPSN
jgi:acetyl esterase/lipase